MQKECVSAESSIVSAAFCFLVVVSAGVAVSCIVSPGFLVALQSGKFKMYC